MSPEAAAEEGFFQRLKADPALAGLLGAGTRVFAVWPGDTLQPGDYPRLSLYCFGPGPDVGRARVRATLDEWIWPTGSTGGRPKLLAIDARVVELFDGQHFTFGDCQIYAQVGGFRDAPAAVNRPMRRTREITLDAWAL